MTSVLFFLESVSLCSASIHHGVNYNNDFFIFYILDALAFGGLETYSETILRDSKELN